jgi:predicted nucleic acid-binding protein
VTTTFVDSSVWIAFFNGLPAPAVQTLAELLRNDEAVTGDLVLMEVLQGFRFDRSVRTALELFEAVPVLELGGKPAAMAAAAVYRTLRERGRTIRGPIDCLIATRCLRDGLPLLTSDKDFAPFAEHLGLQLAV